MTKLFWTFLIFTTSAYGQLPLMDHADILKRLTGHLQNRGDLIRKFVKRKGDKTVEVELFVASELNLKLSRSILEDFPNYRHWVLKNFNIRPSGKEYRFKILDMAPHTPQSNTLLLKYQINIPLISRTSQQGFKCSAHQRKDYYEIQAVSVPETDPFIEYAHGRALFFNEPGKKDRVWTYAQGVLKLKSWWMYQALPEKMILNFIGSRIDTLLANLLELQDEKVLAPKTKRNAAAKR